MKEQWAREKWVTRHTWTLTLSFHKTITLPRLLRDKKPSQRALTKNEKYISTFDNCKHYLLHMPCSSDLFQLIYQDTSQADFLYVFRHLQLVPDEDHYRVTGQRDILTEIKLTYTKLHHTASPLPSPPNRSETSRTPLTSVSLVHLERYICNGKPDDTIPFS